MKHKKVIFDMDDVLWHLNVKAAKMAGIDINKLTHFLMYDNPNITENERERMLAVYSGTELYKNIEFNEQIVWLVNFIHNNFTEYETEIISNCASQEIKNIKLPQLMDVVDLPEERIHLNVIDIETGSTKKKLPEGIFLFVDDSPHNIVLGDAIHRIMPARVWNNVLVNSQLNGLRVERPKSDHELANMVTHFLMEGK